MRFLVQTLFISFIASSEASSSTKNCRCRPSDACWPSEAAWNRLNETVQGRLVALRPLGSVCHGSEFNADECETVRLHSNDSGWRYDQPAALQWVNWEAWPAEHESCYPTTKRNIPCGQGRVSLYSLEAEYPRDIQAGVRFAIKHNIRLAIRNTGHDFAGRSAAVESLQINTHRMTEKKYIPDFVPTGTTSPKKSEGKAVVLGAGVQLYDMYKWLDKHDIMVVGGSSHGVGIAGGYIQGGGHSMLASYMGMASDNALEFSVVTADGEHVTANAYQNSDLFWALRGGGGGTWGVVTSVVVRAFDDPPIVSFQFSGGTPYGNESYWRALEMFHEFLPRFNGAGGSMYYYMLPNFTDPSLGHLSVLSAFGGFANYSDASQADHIMKPLVADLGRIMGFPLSYNSTSYRKSSSLFTAFFSDPGNAGGSAILGSRIMTRDFLSTASGPKKLVSALRSLRADHTTQFQGLVVAGGQAAANADKVHSALHPVWRRALVEVIIPRGWLPTTPIPVQQAIQRNLTEVEVPILKALDPSEGGGTYLNEADGYELDFQDSFWGENYPKLYQLKQKWDPHNLFIVRSGVGSEDWDDEGMCRK